jgi:uncharacterized protein
MPTKPEGVPSPPEEGPVAIKPPLPSAAGATPSQGAGVVAIVIDDMGSSLQEAEQLLAIGVPLTFSVIPGLPKARQVAELAHLRGAEVMIHIPMEPRDYPERRLEANGLLTSYPDDEIARRVNGYFQAIPHAFGANNHMGSRFTEDSGKMGVVLRVLRHHHALFLDSVTSDRSVGYSLSRQLGVRTVRRDVFLDNVQDVGAIRHELERVAALARRGVSAVAICHPHPATIRALSQSLPGLQREGIRFVAVSAVAR